MFLVPFFRGLARHLHLACLAVTAFSAAAFAQTTTPSAADGFDPNVDGAVFAMVTQPSDGKIIVAGQFLNVQPNGGTKVARSNIARFNPDGSLDTSFDPNANGAVRAVVLQKNGQIVIGGEFTTVDGVVHPYICRLNPNGSPDTTFTAAIGKNIGSSFQPAPQVFALAIQPIDDSVVVGGSFGSASSNGVAAVKRRNLARFDKTGALDLTYDPSPDSIVLALASYNQTEILAGGGFLSFLPNGTTTAVSSSKLARIRQNGSVYDDSTLGTYQAPIADDGVASIAVQSDGKVVIGGYFKTITTFRNVTNDDTKVTSKVSAAETRLHLARLNADGSLDATFKPAVAGNVFAITIGYDGAILIGGHFTQTFSPTGGLVNHPYVARLSGVDGVADSAFNPSVNADVNAIVVQGDGSIVIGGLFTRAWSNSTYTQLVRNHIARIQPSGAIDTDFVLDTAGRVLASATQTTDNKIVVGGSFTTLGGATRYFLARLNPDGTVDPTFNPSLNGAVYAVAYDAKHGKILVGGAFTQVGLAPTQTTRKHIARFNLDGQLDTSFDPNIDATVSSILIQPDDNILVAGQFTSLQPAGTDTAVGRAYILRLTTDGKLDTAFNPSASSTVSVMALQSDGKIVVGGAFRTFQPGAKGTYYYRNYIARLNADGTVDSDYNPNTNGTISAIVIQSDDKAVIAGDFTGFLPPKATAVAYRYRIARINKDGTIDSFDPSADASITSANTANNVLALGLQKDGKIIMGGSFTSLKPNGATTETPIRHLARLNTDGTIDNTVNLEINEQPGNRVDYIAVQPSGDFLIGGPFISLKDSSGNRVVRRHLARITAAGTLDTTFDPQPAGVSSNTIKALSIQADGKILVGGLFTDVGGATASNGVSGNNLARFTPEGTPDNAFNGALGADGVVNAIASRPFGNAQSTQLNGFAWVDANGALRSSFTPSTQITGTTSASVVLSDGSIVLAGTFTEASGKITGNVIKFSRTGTLDENYKPIVAGVTGMLRQSDDKIIIYGSFTTVGSKTFNYIARLNTDGTPDETFQPNPSGIVNTAALQSDGSVIIGGQFTALTPNGDTSSTTRAYAARVTSAGKLESTFNPNLNGPVNAIAINAAGQIILGGSFTTVQPGTATTATTRNRLVRFNPDGTLDTTFDPNANDTVYALAVQPDDQYILVGGSFSSVGGGTHYNLARLKTDGTADAAFSAMPDAAVSGLAISPADKSILIRGSFSTVMESGSTTPVSRFRIARLTAAGKLINFNPGIAGTITNATLLSDNSVLIGGDFSSEFITGIAVVGGGFKTIGGVAQPYLAELNADGSVTSQFTPNPDGPVNAVAQLPSGGFVVGGTFTNISGTARVGIARYTEASALDTTFTPSLTDGVQTLAVQTDGKIIVAPSTGTSLIRLNTDGSRDASFSAGAPFAPANAIAVQSDGKILVAGPGSGVGPRILRLNTDGSVDSSFTAQSITGSSIETITLQANGRIMVAGTFTAIGGQAIKNLARLTSTGGVDTTFNPNVNATVSALALQSDGRLVIGGSFTQVGGLQRFSLARLANSSPVTSTLGVSSDGHIVTWIRSGSAAELYGVRFEYYAADTKTWQLIGYPSRLGASNWQLTNAALATNTNVQIRARGYFQTTAGKSTGLYETLLMANPGSQVSSTQAIVGPVTSSTLWDTSHYVWTVDSAGVLRIADAYSFVTYESAGTALVNGGSVGGKTSASASPRLADLSTRGVVNGSSPLISGFAIVGSSDRQVLIRAAGPGLAPFGVSNFLRVPQLVLYNSAGTVLATNSGWNASLLTDFARVGAFPFAANSTDAAFLVKLAPGNYTVRVADAGDGLGGDTLIEIYDAGDQADTSSHLANLSTRGVVDAANTLIGGLYVAGNTPKTMLIRGIGPALARWGVANPLADPVIAVYDANGTQMIADDNWGTSPTSSVANPDYAAGVSSAAIQAGAFPLDANSTDAALVITLQPGSYTVQLRSADGTAGTGLVEVYELR
jgi:uncharacterized delta-60 repeat protein